jgi:hypothetical protein
VLIEGPGIGQIDGYLQDDFSFSVDGNYSPIFEQGELQSGIGKAISVGLNQFAGISLVNQYASAQVWTGSSPIQFDLKMDMYAHPGESPEVIHKRIKTLVKAALPGGTRGGMLEPPGTTLAKGVPDAATRTSVRIGQFLHFDWVVIESVTPTFHALMSSSGLPIYATVDVRFKTFFVPTKQDMDKIYTA